MRSRRAAWAVWLVCLCIFAASLDRVPDPPAIKQTPHSQGVDLSSQLQPAQAANAEWLLERLDPDFPRSFLASLCTRTNLLSPDDSPLVRQASDPSPPARVS